MSDEVKKRFDKAIEDIKRELDALAKRVEEYISRGEVYRAYRVWRDGVLDALKTLRKTIDSFGEELKSVKMSEEEAQAVANRIREGVKEVISRIEETGKKLRDSVGGRVVVAFWGPKHWRHFVHELVSSIEWPIDKFIEGVERLVSDIERSLEDFGKRVTQVVSVRIRDRDLEVIDMLVDAGIFKSRSEAVAFFVRKGIEASKEWIDKALEQVKKIKELQESIRKEIGFEEDESDEND